MVYKRHCFHTNTLEGSAALESFTLMMALEESKGISCETVNLSKQDLDCEAV